MRNKTYRILADGHTVSNDTWETGLNNNDLIIGPSGAGKTRGYVIPNILKCRGQSLIVTDTKGSLREQTEAALIQAGYKIINIDFTDCGNSYGWNPLDGVRYDRGRDKYREQDILTIAAGLAPVESTHDPFWDLSARMVLESLIAYTLECLPKEEHTLNSVYRIFREMGNQRFRRLFQELSELDPASFAVSRYDLYRTNVRAEKMFESIKGVLGEKLSPLMFDGAGKMYSADRRMDFSKISHELTAVFVNVSDTDRSLDRLVGLFFYQALHELCNTADKSPGHRLDIPVRLIIDDFAAGTVIPDFDSILSVIRSREIYVSIILQSISQLESLYGHTKATTIMNNCDHLIYLGGQDAETARYIGTKAGKSAGGILSMPLGSAWIFERGNQPRQVRKYCHEDREEYLPFPSL